MVNPMINPIFLIYKDLRPFLHVFKSLFILLVFSIMNIPAHIIGTAEQVTPDRLTFHGKKWIVIKSNNWKIYNGWCKVIVVEDKDYGQNRESNLG